MINKCVFFYFPYKRHPTILYRNRKILETKLFSVLHNKLFPNNFILRQRKNNPILRSFIEYFSSTTLSIPNNNIQLVYYGYDNKIFFEFDETLKIKDDVWYLNRNGFIKKEFIGYPVYYDYSKKSIDNGLVLQCFLKKHWNHIRNTGKLHGDFNHMNILIKNKHDIRAIDPKSNTNNSDLTDHFYFFAYLLFMYQTHNKKNIDGFNILKENLRNILLPIFKNERKDSLLKSIHSLNFEKLGRPETKRFINIFIKDILEL